MFQTFIYVIAFGYSVADTIYSGARIRIFPSRTQGQKGPGSGFATKNLSIFNPKFFSTGTGTSGKYDPGCLSRIRIFFPSRIRIPNPGVKKVPDPRSATLFFM